MKYYLFISVFFCFYVKSQTINPSVITSAAGGGTVGATGVEVYYNIGEPIVSTVINSLNAITQGFYSQIL